MVEQQVAIELSTLKPKCRKAYTCEQVRSYCTDLITAAAPQPTVLEVDVWSASSGTGRCRTSWPDPRVRGPVWQPSDAGGQFAVRRLSVELTALIGLLSFYLTPYVTKCHFKWHCFIVSQKEQYNIQELGFTM